MVSETFELLLDEWDEEYDGAKELARMFRLLLFGE